MASLVYLVLYLYLHACTARPLMVWDKETVAQLQLYSKDVKTSLAGRFETDGNFRAGHIEKTSYHGTNVMQLDNQKSSSVKEAENNEGKKVKISYSWKILHRATGTEIWKRAERSTLESPPCNAEENVSSSKDNDKVEDIVVMDYAQPHRKPPIHNKGT
ncbi:hypothetical protein Pfo_025590 [Paulownia fortunei]|nr:hypothetical protein Pfo_025590 [Paulownia fortunei]